MTRLVRTTPTVLLMLKGKMEHSLPCSSLHLSELPDHYYLWVALHDDIHLQGQLLDGMETATVLPLLKNPSAFMKDVIKGSMMGCHFDKGPAVLTLDS